MDTMKSSRYVFDATEATFERDVLERSRQVPVVVDFWAAWCGPCRALGPVLERLAVEADGAWVLAKVDVDANPGLASAFGVQGIPAVRAFRGGREVAEFTGALPEPAVREWLLQLGPSPADLAYEEGAVLEAAGRLDEAADRYRRALAEAPAHEAATVALTRVELALRTAGLDGDDLRQRAGSGDLDAILALADPKPRPATSSRPSGGWSKPCAGPAARTGNGSGGGSWRSSTSPRPAIPGSWRPGGRWPALSSDRASLRHCAGRTVMMWTSKLPPGAW
jgi:thioredoxin